MSGPDPLPASAPERLVVEGILEGRVLNADQLHEAADALGRTGAGAFRLDVSGGRFSLLPLDTHVPADAFDAAAQGGFLDRLQAVCDGAQPGSVESTLRCTMVYPDEVAETLFVAKGAQIEPLTRRRPRRAHDAAPSLARHDVEASLGLRRRQLLWIAPLLLVAGGLLAWQTGWIDRVLAARTEEMAADSGPFGDMLAIALERSWGDYRATLTRGPTYPTTPDQLASQKAASADLQQQAACDRVGNGGTAHVQLRDGDGELLAEVAVELAPLLTDADGAVTARLPGRMAAKTVTLSISSGKKAR